MADDLYLGMAHSPDVGLCVFSGRAGNIDGSMHTDNTIIKLFQNIIGDVQISLSIQYVCLRAIAQGNAEAASLA